MNTQTLSVQNFVVIAATTTSQWRHKFMPTTKLSPSRDFFFYWQPVVPMNRRANNIKRALVMVPNRYRWIRTLFERFRIFEHLFVKTFPLISLPPPHVKDGSDVPGSVRATPFSTFDNIHAFSIWQLENDILIIRTTFVKLTDCCELVVLHNI